MLADVVAEDCGDITLPFPYLSFQKWRDYDVEVDAGVDQSLQLLQVRAKLTIKAVIRLGILGSVQRPIRKRMQTACFLRDNLCMEEVAGSVAAHVRQVFRSSVKAELQLSLAALPWPVQAPSDSQFHPMHASIHVRVGLLCSVHSLPSHLREIHRSAS